ncbi:hypothetical protein DPEC_G00264770 [Dallia pectoralis]|uniref:Uncharacterized protein n=1 Tax=Dallia pectoralis TaxID=75939 RepID=A0ACC2FSQ7_DALPE|nr:hypothetical protein DPEC_G00264770 [Dallia pectoralis]
MMLYTRAETTWGCWYGRGHSLRMIKGLSLTSCPVLHVLICGGAGVWAPRGEGPARPGSLAELRLTPRGMMGAINCHHNTPYSC